ncbi:MAG: hypothetical protein COC24_013600, partial [Alphaproteobacteria bacterium]|nr:hypothetical protein [Alphaproteobacteria bacterium]
GFMNSIIVICEYFHPMTNTRAMQANRMATVLAKNFNVEVITTDYAGEFIEFSNPNIKVTRVKSLKNSWLLKPYIVQKINEYFVPFIGYFWAKSVFKQLESRNQKSTIILTISHPIGAHFVGLFAKRSTITENWVAFFSDPWPSSILAGKARRYVPISAWLQENIMRKFLSECDDILLTNLNATKYLENKLSVDIEHKTHIVPHLLPNDRPAKADVKIKKTLFHAGQMNAERVSVDFLKAFKLFSEMPVYKDYKIATAGFVCSNFMHEVEKLQLTDKFEFLGKLDFEQVIEIGRTSTAQLLFESNSADNPFILSKLTDVDAIQRPVLSVTNKNSAMDIFFAKSDFCALLYHEENVEKMLLKLVTFIKKVENSTVDFVDFYEFYDDDIIAKTISKIVSEGTHGRSQ